MKINWTLFIPLVLFLVVYCYYVAVLVPAIVNFDFHNFAVDIVKEVNQIKKDAEK